MAESFQMSRYVPGGLFQDPGGDWRPLGDPPVPTAENIEAAGRYMARYAGLARAVCASPAEDEGAAPPA